MAGSVRVAAGGRGGVGAVRRVWALRGASAQPAATASTAQVAVRRLVVEQRVVEVRVLSKRAALALEKSEELHARARAGLE